MIKKRTIKKVKKLLIAASGLGTRFLPVTSSLPKEMFPIIDKPVFQYVLEEGIVNGIEEVILVISKDKQILLDYLKRSTDKSFKKLLKSIKITIVYREPQLLGNAAPILSSEKYLKNEPFLVLWADSFALRRDGRISDILNLYSKVQKPVICLFPFFEKARFIYAIPKTEKTTNGQILVKRIFEKPGMKKIQCKYAFGNGYLLEPDIFPYIKRTKVTKEGEIVLETAVDKYCQKNITYASIFKKPFFEVGNKEDYVKNALKLFKYRNNLNDI